MIKRIIALSLLSILINIFFNFFLDIKSAFYGSYFNFLDKVDIERNYNNYIKNYYISLILIELVLLLKTILIASVLFVGTFFFSKLKVSFKALWDAVIKAEFLFLGVGILKILWFYFFHLDYNLEDLQYFYPLSALNIIGYQDLEAWFIYPLQTLNLFELGYWLLLSYFIGKLAFSEKDKGNPMDLGFKIVASSYGSALLLWMVVVMFFTLNYS